jgi:hypothetical protein
VRRLATTAGVNTGVMSLGGEFVDDGDTDIAWGWGPEVAGDTATYDDYLDPSDCMVGPDANCEFNLQFLMWNRYGVEQCSGTVCETGTYTVSVTVDDVARTVGTKRNGVPTDATTGGYGGGNWYYRLVVL